MKPRICICCGERISEEARTEAPKCENLCGNCAYFLCDCMNEPAVDTASADFMAVAEELNPGRS